MTHPDWELRPTWEWPPRPAICLNEPWGPQHAERMICSSFPPQNHTSTPALGTPLPYPGRAPCMHTPHTHTAPHPPCCALGCSAQLRPFPGCVYLPLSTARQPPEGSCAPMGWRPAPSTILCIYGWSLCGWHPLSGPVGKVQEGPGGQGAGTPNSQSPHWVTRPEAQEASRTWGLFSELRQRLQPEVRALSHPWVCHGPAHILLAETRPYAQDKLPPQ